MSSQWFPADAVHILVVLFLSLLIGLEREEHKTTSTHYTYGGIRTLPLIGLLGYGIARATNDSPMAVGLGLAAMAVFMGIAYFHKLAVTQDAGVTSEMTGLLVYVLGVLVSRDLVWIAVSIGVLSLVLLELRVRVDALTKRFPPAEVSSAARFLLLTAVILPVVPNHAFGAMQINPFKVWLVVVAVSGISYASYLLQMVLRGSGGVLVAGMLGGAYSSTATTVALGKASTAAHAPRLYAGAITMASGVMYVRLALLLLFFNAGLFHLLVAPFLILAAVGVVAGWLTARTDPHTRPGSATTAQRPNPLQIGTAFLFAGIFVAMLVITQLVVTHGGGTALYSLAGVMGVTDVDPFIMSLTQSAGHATPLALAAGAIVVAAASNNMVKGVYAAVLADRETGRTSAALLGCLALLGVLPLLLVRG
ncbi:MAG: DUF4010 domain-containing protein [Armatimonadetes bacterium]|nr:DUF4010 domain-containing protein [Armatimonadota bacterium]MDE2205851.1 DUF4010 domain-containing protein [Armatimonadota bacterium]